MGEVNVDIGYTRPEKVTLSLTKDGLVSDVDGKIDRAMVVALKSVIDTAAWSHSWHVDFSMAQYKHSPGKERAQVRGLLDERITSLEGEVECAKQVRAMFRRWK